MSNPKPILSQLLEIFSKDKGPTKVDEFLYKKFDSYTLIEFITENKLVPDEISYKGLCSKRKLVDLILSNLKTKTITTEI